MLGIISMHIDEYLKCLLDGPLLLNVILLLLCIPQFWSECPFWEQQLTCACDGMISSSSIPFLDYHR
jgi:hypothetical protein